MAIEYDDRHRRVLEQLLLHGTLGFETLQAKAKLRRSDDQFGLVLGDLAEQRGKKAPSKTKPVEWWWEGDDRFYRVKPSVVASMLVRK